MMVSLPHPSIDSKNAEILVGMNHRTYLFIARCKVLEGKTSRLHYRLTCDSFFVFVRSNFGSTSILNSPKFFPCDHCTPGEK
mmetsp:Transcript_42007/g.101229  ORF Transcript_42007/g.101229 Transcript_42007/m.101229 type:complete len:82 (-) Transcript_42007:1164-1409(-)